MLKLFFVTLFSCKVPWKRLQQSGTREIHSTTSRVYPLHFFRALAASYVLYNRTEHTKRFFYLLITGNIVSTNSNSYSFRSFFR